MSRRVVVSLLTSNFLPREKIGNLYEANENSPPRDKMKLRKNEMKLRKNEIKVRKNLFVPPWRIRNLYREVFDFLGDVGRVALIGCQLLTVDERETSELSE